MIFTAEEVCPGRFTGRSSGYPEKGLDDESACVVRWVAAGWSRLTHEGEVKVSSQQIKLFSAAIGASALLAMGAFSVAATTAAQEEDTTVAPGPVTTSEITTGETVTETVAPEAPETTVVTPPVTAEPAPVPD